MKFFAAYVVLGYPDLSTSFDLIKQLDSIGTDIIEVGVPFSDPMADGGVIQGASQRAIKNGVTPFDAFEVPDTNAELYVMTYSNIIHHMGFREFTFQAERSGYSGIIVPDLPLEHQVSMGKLNQVQLIGPNTPFARAKELSIQSQGFLYIISHLATTGGRAEVDPRIAPLLNELKKYSTIRKMIGFGIDTPSMIPPILSTGADGVIVGSSLIQKFREEGIDATVKLASRFLEEVHSYREIRVHPRPEST